LDIVGIDHDNGQRRRDQGMDKGPFHAADGLRTIAVEPIVCTRAMAVTIPLA
jgi:hypothetical protein